MTALASTFSSAHGAPNDVPLSSCALSASVTSGLAWPQMAGPHEPMKSTYLFPSTSKQYGPCTRSKMMGCPPTDLKARTGELTPPGRRFWASAKIWEGRRWGKGVAEEERGAGGGCSREESAQTDKG